MNENSYTSLLHRLDEFIRKYYKNQLIHGAIYFAAVTLVFFLLVIVLEYFGRYQSGVRALLFYSFVGVSGFCLVRFVLIPLSKLYKLGQTIDYAQASIIIGEHFPQVKDKLLNVLQLKQEAGAGDHSLVNAAINQKTAELKPIPFTSAIDLGKNKRYLRYVVLPIMLYALLYILAPSMISDSGKRVLYYNQTFKPVAPFSFVIENKELSAQQFSDFELDLKITGSELPDEVYVEISGNRYKMKQQDKTHYVYTFTNIQKDVPFVFVAGEFFSDEYVLKSIAKPLIISYRAKLEFAAYLGKKAEWMDNPTDFTIPAGTVVNWQFITTHTNDVLLGFAGQYLKANQEGKDEFGYSKKFFVSSNYVIKTQNASTPTTDSMQYSITVLPDAFPSITAEEKQDTVSGKQLFFIGDASDDHGLTRLAFHYQLTRFEQTKPEPRQMQWLPLERNLTSTRFYHQLNLNAIGMMPGDELTYYFEVWDNDGVHGSKSTKTAVKELKAPSEKELEQKTEAGSNALKDKMEQAIKDAKSLQKEMKELDRKMLDKKELTWEEKKKMEKLLEQQKELAKKLADIKKENEKLNKEEAEYKKQEENILEKQQQLEKMFNELMDDEMKKLIKEMEKLMQMQNKDLMKDEMEKMQLNNKDVEKELDRMLEQYKKLELDKKLEQTIDKLDKLADKQQQLANKTQESDKGKNSEEKKQAREELKKEQEKLSEQFKEAKEELKDIEEKNKELEDPNELENTEEEQKDIEQQQEESEKDIEKGDTKKASEKQQKAAKQLQKMSQKMKSKKQEQEEKELELDAQALREILENTIQLSKDQEDLMEQLRGINGYNPQFVEAAQTQKKIKDNAKIIEDSLLSLSKRVAEISSFVNREVSKLNDNLDRSVKGFGTRNFGEIRTRQQYSMTAANNLAVMLSDVLKQMQDQMSGQGEGQKGKGKPKPGQGKGKGKGQGKGKSLSELKKAQEELNKQLREGLNKQDGDKGKDGQKPGDKPGQGKPGQGMPGMGGMSSQEFARMAAQQQAIRQQMQKMLNQMGSKEKEGLGGNGKLQEMQKLMEQTEKELYNKQLTNQLLQRQKEILTRLLESEKAERKQEQDQKREAEQAKEKPAPPPPSFDKYIQQKNKEKELLETIPADMQPYYKEKTKEYFKKVGAQ